MKAFLFPAVVALLLIAACGGDDDPVEPAYLQFMQTIRDEAGDVLCRTDDFRDFYVEALQVRVDQREDGTTVTRCTGEDGLTGEVVWQAATATDSEGRTMELTSNHIRPEIARAEDDAGSGPAVVFQFTDEGALLFEEITTRNQGYMLGMFLDGELISGPRVQVPISGGQTQIFGMTLEEAEVLAARLNAGAGQAP